MKACFLDVILFSLFPAIHLSFWVLPFSLIFPSCSASSVSSLQLQPPETGRGNIKREPSFFSFFAIPFEVLLT